MESILYDSKNSQTYKFGLRVLEYVPRDRSLSMIDIGSGSGALTKELSHYGGYVIGIDNDLRTIEQAKKKYPTVPFYFMDALRLQYENRFDIAFSNATFHCIEDKKTLFASIYKCLRKGGKLIAEFASKNGNIAFFERLDALLEKYNIDKSLSTYHFIDKEECEAMLKEAGFRVELIEENSHKTYVRGDEDDVRDMIRSTVGKNIPREIRSKIIDELLRVSEDKFKNSRGFTREVCRIRVVAVKDNE